MPRLGVRPGPRRTNKSSHLMWPWQCFTWKVAIRIETHSRAVGRLGHAVREPWFGNHPPWKFGVLVEPGGGQ